MKTTIILIPAAFALFSLSSCNETQEKETSAETSTLEAEKAITSPPPEEATTPETTEEEESNSSDQALDMAKQMAAQLLKDKGGDRAKILGSLLENTDTEGIMEKAQAMGVDLNSLMSQANNLTDEQKAQIDAAKTQLMEQLGNLSDEDKANMLKQGQEILKNLLKSSSETPEDETEGE